MNVIYSDAYIGTLM